MKWLAVCADQWVINFILPIRLNYAPLTTYRQASDTILVPSLSSLKYFLQILCTTPDFSLTASSVSSKPILYTFQGPYDCSPFLAAFSSCPLMADFNYPQSRFPSNLKGTGKLWFPILYPNYFFFFLLFILVEPPQKPPKKALLRNYLILFKSIRAYSFSIQTYACPSDFCFQIIKEFNCPNFDFFITAKEYQVVTSITVRLSAFMVDLRAGFLINLFIFRFNRVYWTEAILFYASQTPSSSTASQNSKVSFHIFLVAHGQRLSGC